MNFIVSVSLARRPSPLMLADMLAERREGSKADEADDRRKRTLPSFLAGDLVPRHLPRLPTTWAGDSQRSTDARFRFAKSPATIT